MTQPDVRLAEIEARHSPVTYTIGDDDVEHTGCTECGDDWPRDAATLLAMLKEGTKWP